MLGWSVRCLVVVADAWLICWKLGECFGRFSHPFRNHLVFSDHNESDLNLIILAPSTLTFARRLCTISCRLACAIWVSPSESFLEIQHKVLSGFSRWQQECFSTFHSSIWFRS